MYLFAPKK